MDKTSKKIPSSIKASDLFGADLTNKIVENAENIQDKAFFAVLWDSGRRLREIQSPRIKDVEFDRIGAVIHVEGKVGPFDIRIGASAPRLALWLDNHPNRNDPESPLWVQKTKGRWIQLSYGAMRKRLKRALVKTGIETRVWPYLFRHSRYGSVKDTLNDHEENILFGWKDGSTAKKAYQHFSQGDRDKAFLKMNGLADKDIKPVQTRAYVPSVCTRCSRKNSPDAKFCNRCGLALDIKYAMRVDERKQSIKGKLDTMADLLATSPEIADKLLGALERMRSSRSS